MAQTARTTARCTTTSWIADTKSRYSCWTTWRARWLPHFDITRTAVHTLGQGLLRDHLANQLDGAPYAWKVNTEMDQLSIKSRGRLRSTRATFYHQSCGRPIVASTEYPLSGGLSIPRHHSPDVLHPAFLLRNSDLQLAPFPFPHLVARLFLSLHCSVRSGSRTTKFRCQGSTGLIPQSSLTASSRQFN